MADSDDRPLDDSYWLVRKLIVHSLGFIYFVAFLILINQGVPLLGDHGLLPIRDLSGALSEKFQSSWKAFFFNPSLFQFFSSTVALRSVSIAGLLLSVPLVLGFANFPILFLLWFLHLSVVNSGQLFYSYGWETQLLEFTFLCFFLCPLIRPNLMDPRSPPKKIAIVFLRWMLFRLMLGAGLIKLRGDPCWRDLTCLIYHYELQPNPHPLSWFYSQMPGWFHVGGALFNHFVEVALPFGVFGPKRLRRIVGVFMILFQLILISSGNLSWLNWITLFMAFACFDDEWILKVGRLKVPIPSEIPFSRTVRVTLYAFGIGGGLLSLQPAFNLISSHQLMNASFSRLHLINTYGAFGTVGRERHEIVISGTDSDLPDEKALWKEYEFKCKPGRLDRRPCLITPYHLRLDWQIWFSAMEPRLSEIWLARFVKRLLEGDRDTLTLIDVNPFPTGPPKWIRMDLYRYRFTHFGEQGWWKRDYFHPYSRSLRLSDLKEVE